MGSKEECGAPQEVSGTESSADGFRQQLLAGLVVLAWMCFSSFFILLFKMTVDREAFPFPLALTAGHMGTCWLAFATLRRTSLKGWLMPDVDIEISWEDYLRAIVPIALFTACGLALGNFAVTVSSVAFLQMIKPANLIWGSVVAFLFSVEPATLTHVLIVFVVISGVSLASHSNAEFNLAGFLLQLTATATEGSKLVLIQTVTSKRLKLDPLTTVYRYAPLAFTCLGILSLTLEGAAVFERLSSSKVLVLLNCFAAVILNVLIVGTISRTSAVVFILAGVVKDIGTIAASVIVFGSVVGLSQMVGFGMSLVGIMMYKAYKQHLDSFLAWGFLGGFKVALGLQASATAMPDGSAEVQRANRGGSANHSPKVMQESDDEEMCLIGKTMDDDDDFDDGSGGDNNKRLEVFHDARQAVQVEDPL